MLSLTRARHNESSRAAHPPQESFTPLTLALKHLRFPGPPGAPARRMLRPQRPTASRPGAPAPPRLREGELQAAGRRAAPPPRAPVHLGLRPQGKGCRLPAATEATPSREQGGQKARVRMTKQKPAPVQPWQPRQWA